MIIFIKFESLESCCSDVNNKLEVPCCDIAKISVSLLFEFSIVAKFLIILSVEFLAYKENG